MPAPHPRMHGLTHVPGGPDPIPGLGGTASPLTTKGDVWGFGTADARIPVGANGEVLTADSTQTLGVKWAPTGVGSSAMTLLHSVTLAADGTFDQSGISGAYNDLMIQLIVRGTRASASDTLQLRFNNDSAANYGAVRVNVTGTSVAANETPSANSIQMANIPAASAAAGVFATLTFLIPGYASTTWLKNVAVSATNNTAITAAAIRLNFHSGIWNSTAAITRVQFLGLTTANLVTGSVMRIYGIT